MAMEHGKNKAGPARDDLMKRDLQEEIAADRSLRMEEERELRPTAEGAPADRGLEAGLSGGTPPEMTPEDVRTRSELAQHLGRSMYPADKRTIIETLRRNHAPDRLLELAEHLPKKGKYPNVQSIAESLGLGTEEHRT